MDDDLAKVILLNPMESKIPNVDTEMISSMVDMLKSIDDELDTYFGNTS